MKSAQQTLASVIMYLWARHIVEGRNSKQKVERADHGDYDAIRIAEHFYVLAQICGW